MNLKNINLQTTNIAMLVLGFAFSVSFLSGCNYNDSKNQPTAPRKAGGEPNGTRPDAVVDFATVKSLVFDQSCTKCHGPTLAKAGLRLDQYASTFAKIDLVRDEVEGGTMPPPPPRGAILSPEQKALLIAWIDSGAPETTVVTPPPTTPNPPAEPSPTVPLPVPPSVPPTTPGPSPATPDFAMVSQAVFVPHCVKCHGATMQKGHVNLEEYANASAHTKEIADSLDTDDMPRKAPALDPKLKAIVYAWIDAGAPETVTPGTPVPAPTTPGPAPVAPKADNNNDNNNNDDGDHHGGGHGGGHDGDRDDN
ncbi:hypothetical protein BH10BDE1_BH10BDE1_10270 [soil metagenome]